MAKRPVPLYDFKAFGAAIKAARNEYGESRKKVSDELYISPRYLANIENKGQQPSLQVFYDLVTRYHISVDQFFFPNSNAEKSTGRRQLDALLDGMSDKGIGDIRKYQLFVVDLLHISRPLSIFFTLSRAALSCFALSFAAARALRIEGFFSRFSFFAENS